MPLEDSSRVSVHDKNRMIAGVEQDRIRGLWAHTVKSEQLFAQFGCRVRKHFRERPVIPFIEKTDESFQALSFLSKISRRADQCFQFRLRRVPNSVQC